MINEKQTDELYEKLHGFSTDGHSASSFISMIIQVLGADYPEDDLRYHAGQYHDEKSEYGGDE